MLNEKSREASYRPESLDRIVGQEQVKELLSFSMKSAEMRGVPLDHVLISGASGTGKSTLSYAIAHDMGCELKVVSGPTLKAVDDVVDVLMAVSEGQMIFIDEIHALPRKVQEQLYFAMEQFVVDANIDGMPTRMPIPRFTLVGATTDLGGLEEPCRNRFPIQVVLEPYTPSDLTGIVMQSAVQMGLRMDRECAQIVASSSRGVPRIANSRLGRVRDVALVANDGVVTPDVVRKALSLLGIDEQGLDRNDHRYLSFLADARKAVGVDAISLSLGTDRVSIETVIEPYLLQKGYISRSARGRSVTEAGLRAIGR